MTRRAHLVGSIPGNNAKEAMEAALTHLAPYLLTLSDGETGPRSWWIGACLHNLESDPDIEVVRRGDFSSYEKTSLFGVREGVTLSSKNLDDCLPYESAFRESFPLFKKLRVTYGRPDLPFQVGIPTQLDLSVDTFGYPDGMAPHLYEPCLDATANQLMRIHAAGGEDIVFQMETPASLIAVAGADESAAPTMAQHIAERLIRSSPLFRPDFGVEWRQAT